MAGPLDTFLGWCDKLAIKAPGGRKATLTAATKAGTHETVLFFPCGQDYVNKATDLKLSGIQTLFMGQGTPFEINISAGALAAARGTLAGARPGGAANYNLGTKAISEMTAGFGAMFMNDMIRQINTARSGAGMVSPMAVTRTEQDMRNRVRRFWMGDTAQIGL